MCEICDRINKEQEDKYFNKKINKRIKTTNTLNKNNSTERTK